MNKRKRIIHSDFSRVLANRLESKEKEVTDKNAIRPINCAIQTYAWGRIGTDSAAARLKAAQSDGEFEIDEFTPYAELWMGTHPNGMSKIKDMEGNEDSLLNYVRNDPMLHFGKKDETDLTYLLKVLSINKVLSIQAHPDKKLAEQLHDERPKVYKDDNHKPEMAIAITDDVEGMCGFLPLSVIVNNLDEYPELEAVVGEEAAAAARNVANASEQRDVYQKLFRSYMEAPSTVFLPQLNSMLRKIRYIPKEDHNSTQTLMLKLATQFPGDSGIFAPLLLNHLKLKRGEAFFIGANEPHAYIGGDLVECMACSDNVVRAGLTPKLKDVDTLVSMLTYHSAKPTITTGKKIDRCTRLYAPPVRDFAVEIIEVPAGQSYQLRNVQSPAVLLTLNGSATFIQGDTHTLDAGLGSAHFVSANTKATIEAGENGVCIVRGMSNVYYE